MVTLFKVVTPEWELEVVGRVPSFPPFITLTPTTSIQVIGADTTTLSIFNPRSKTLLEEVPSGTLIEPLLLENTRYDFYLSSRYDTVRLKLPSVAIAHHQRKGLSHYELNYQNDVGLSEIEVVNGKNRVKVRFEVFPLKIDYRTDYVQMRDEVAEITRNLVMTFQVRTFGLAEPFPTTSPTLAEWLSLIKRYFNRLIAIVNAIAQNPHCVLEEHIELVPLARARRVNDRALNKTLRRRVSRVGGIVPETGIPLPDRVPETVRRVTFDTPENQHVKALLVETQRTLQLILRMRSTTDEDSDVSAEKKFLKAIRPEAEDMLSQLRRVLRYPFLGETTVALPNRPSSLVFLRHPHYAALERVARLLNGGLSLGGVPLEIGAKNIAQLYEYWCFLRLVKLLREQLILEQQSIVQTKHLKIVVVLKKGREARIDFREPISGKRLSLVYNRQFNRLPTVGQRPDNVIQLFSETKLYIFDAKYRLAVDDAYQKTYKGIGPTTEDINTMHRYRDAIVLPSRTGVKFIRGVVQGAVVLFPYSDERNYQNQRFYQSIDQVQIGGLPFLPSATQLAESKIRELLQGEGYFS